MPYRCAPVGVVTADMAWMVVQEDGTPVGMSRFASQKACQAEVDRRNLAELEEGGLEE